jgi:hypothetical protein
MSEAHAKPLERARGSLRSFLCSSLIAGLVACSLPPIFVGAAEQKTTESAKPPTPPAPAAPATIPLADIATRATEVSNLIGNLTAGTASLISHYWTKVQYTASLFLAKNEASFGALVTRK